MSILSDIELIERVNREGIIKPFHATLVNRERYQNSDPRYDAKATDRIISYGLSSYGYDCRVVDEYLIYHNLESTYIDPKDFDVSNFIKISGKGYVLIPPNSFALTETIEYIKVPRDCIVLIAAKSTYARCGLVVNATVLEPEWEGTVTLELSNTTPLPVKVYSGEGIVQLLFFKNTSRVCLHSYADRKGKYQLQRGITLPKV